MMSLPTKVRTAWALGVSNIARVLVYKLALKLGVHPVQRLSGRQAGGKFFGPPARPPVDAEIPGDWSDHFRPFGGRAVEISQAPPDWIRHLASDLGQIEDRPWWTVPDVPANGTDIKLIWELSRMEWAVRFAQRARNGDASSLDRLNSWLNDWCGRNPPYRGPQWKCGQETAIRILRLGAAALILDQVASASGPLLDLVEQHVTRVDATLGYALAQDNNHGTSEAAGLFVGGSWLVRNGRGEGAAFAERGRRALEALVSRLVADDGSWSQYSVNYHRVVLDTLSLVEIWRRRMDEPPFSEKFHNRVARAVTWLEAMTDPGNGDAPHLGADDGSYLLTLTDAPFRDFRPSIDLASALFRNRRGYAHAPGEEVARWLGLELHSTEPMPVGSCLFAEGGQAVLSRGHAKAIMLFPHFRFRPSQADAFHVDLWVDGKNLLRDAGTYGYQVEPQISAYFGGVRSHNTIEFDSAEPMPRIGRFLLGDWLGPTVHTSIEEWALETSFSAVMEGRSGWRHARSLTLADDRLRVIDEVGGFKRSAILRWRLWPGSWRLSERGATCEGHVFAVQSTSPIMRMEIVKGWESDHYLDRTELPVLEVEIAAAGTLTSEYRWPG